MDMERHSIGVSPELLVAGPAARHLGSGTPRNYDAFWSTQHRLPVAVCRTDDVHARRDGAVDRHQVRSRFGPSDRGFRSDWIFERIAVAQHAEPLHRSDRAEPFAALPSQRSADRHLPRAPLLGGAGATMSFVFLTLFFYFLGWLELPEAF